MLIRRYKDYYAQLTFDPSADAFHGRVIGIQDVIDFYGRTPDELRQEFQHSVDEYLTWCAEEGTKPEKTWLGKLTIRVDEDLRRRLAVVAAAQGESVNAWITSLLDRETRPLLQEHETDTDDTVSSAQSLARLVGTAAACGVEGSDSCFAPPHRR